MPSRDEPGPSTAPETWGPARRALARVLAPIERFLRVEAASGVVLLVAAVIALAWANSPWAPRYAEVWHAPVTLGVGSFTTTNTVHFWIDDGLMVLFFFVVGLEIRREMHGGELAELRRAALPVVAALGGMVVPALVYVSFNAGRPSQHGWGIPMATDIAFAVGVLALLGRRVPAALRVLLLALAIIDDVGAIVVIAVAYSSTLSMPGFLLAGAGLFGIVALQRLGVRRTAVYVLPGVVVWLGCLRAGIHPTIAGVAIGLLTPVHAAPDESASPSIRLQTKLHPWVAFVVMPLFALANAGVHLGGGGVMSPELRPVLFGVFAGLFLGKPVGIVASSLVAARLGLVTLPEGVRWRGLSLVGCVAGIGFTMAIFIANLAFDDERSLATAKLAVLAASSAAGVFTVVAGRTFLRPKATPDAAATPAEAESSTER